MVVTSRTRGSFEELSNLRTTTYCRTGSTQQLSWWNTASSNSTITHRAKAASFRTHGLIFQIFDCCVCSQSRVIFEVFLKHASIFPEKMKTEQILTDSWLLEFSWSCGLRRIEPMTTVTREFAAVHVLNDERLLKYMKIKHAILRNRSRFSMNWKRFCMMWKILAGLEPNTTEEVRFLDTKNSEDLFYCSTE